ncbi:MAG: DUF2232 domain-containing protein [Nitrospinae bacterium]|nr:DUF2232 domain-containing protein [Nitrospinota bacterium]
MTARGGIVGWVAAPVLSALLFLSILYVPVLGSLLNPFAPLPIIYYAFTHGTPAGAAAVLASAGVIGLLMGPKAGAVYFLSYGLAGLMMATMIRNGKTFTATVLTTAAASMAATALLALAGQGDLAGLYAAAFSAVKGMMAETIAVYEKAGMPDDQIALLKENSDAIALWVVRALPGAMTVLYLSAMFMNYAAYAALRSRWSWLPAASPLELNRWSPPEKTVFFFIIGGGLMLVPDDAAHAVGMNLLIVTVALYFMGGLCVLRHWFERGRLPRFLRWTIYILISFQPFMIAGTAGLGLFDLWLDFRKIRPAKGEKEDTNGSDT